MKKRSLCLSAVLLGLGLPAWAAVSAEDARQLGNTLTEFGAVKAGNKEGSIPPYTGGLRDAPAGFKPGTGFWADPYKDEKPLYRIDAKNMAQYADKLTEGQKHLLVNNPASFYIDVYPSHRTVTYPEHVLKATVRNATACKTLKDNLAVDTACRGGMPFPIPRSGYEAMWNQVLRYIGETDVQTPYGRSLVVDPNGKVVLTAEQQSLTETPYYQTRLTDRDPQLYWRTFAYVRGPARKAGEMSGLMDFLDPTEKPRRAWNYTPGQRRVKLAPEFSYDTPVGSIGGVVFYDELFLFSGKMDRFDFKLVGKKELLIPYNTFGVTNTMAVADFLGPKHVNPTAVRWEKHRVWVVDGTRKAGARHAYSRRTFYVDEDCWCIVASETYDNAGALWRVSNYYTFPTYDTGGFNNETWSTNDLVKGNYFVLNTGHKEKGNSIRSYETADGLPIALTPQAVASTGVR